MPNAKKIKYIYVLSQRYSGSTLLSFLLTTHPEVSTIGERRKFYNKSLRSAEFAHHKAQHCSCGELFADCPYFNAIKERVLAKIDPKILDINTTEFNIFKNKHLNRMAYQSIRFAALRHPQSQQLPFQKKINKLGHFNKILAEEILAMDNSNTFLDTSKIINHALFLSMIEAFDFYVIWLVRDPRAQVNSAIKYNKWSVEKAVNAWKKEMVENKKILQGRNINFIKIRYEDLCRSTTKELTKIGNFTELDASQFSLDFREGTQHIIGNSRMRRGKDQQIVERREWEDQLSKAQVAIIENATRDYRDLYSG